ncbi:type II toxin-antitoxin system RelB/DinJ family antitoxin [Oribacterium parvum]|uniref:type II toxin-antitoxin system RelB/DinJ family antitoxin n=1 Tax=Oribacterium parvum TaxID=1501329 RepID=UPI0028DD3D69|nr:type II toxin-antitoxin system RelB/DinJ family antitoxin [Oribacterium parvum]
MNTKLATSRMRAGQWADNIKDCKAIYMANTKAVYARIDTKLKENAEGILQQLGISPSSAIQMLYSQIVRTNGFPLDLHLSHQAPTAIGKMSQNELNTALQEGYESALTGKKYSVEEINQLMKDNFH